MLFNLERCLRNMQHLRENFREMIEYYINKEGILGMSTTELVSLFCWVLRPLNSISVIWRRETPELKIQEDKGE